MNKYAFEPSCFSWQLRNDGIINLIIDSTKVRLESGAYVDFFDYDHNYSP
jgi:hypothetical protein